tara:strand:- start:364 stop:993 length:630 start_codon:yes stop_codon:yes gene_type:complete
MIKLKILFSILLVTFGISSFSEESHEDIDGHDHVKKIKNEHATHKNHDESEDSHADHKEEGHSDHKEEGHGDHKEEGHSDHKEEGHDDHGGGKAIGKGKAVEEVDEVKGLKLSKEAIKTLQLKLLNVDGDEFMIEKTTLITSKESKGVYRFRGGFFKLLPIETIKEVNGKYLVKVKGVDFGDQIVINGTGLLRIADVYSTDSAEYSHAH